MGQRSRSSKIQRLRDRKPFLPVLCLLAAALLLVVDEPPFSSHASSAAPRQNNQSSEAERSATEPKQARLTLGNPASGQAGVVRLPLHFIAAAGETAGSIAAELVVPDNWKFLKFENGPGMKLKASLKKEPKQNRGTAQPPGTVVIQLSLSAGTHAIHDGLLGMLRFSVSGSPAQGVKQAGAKHVMIRLISTAPPATEQVNRSSEAPDSMPAEQPANPNVACFFFSH